MEFEVRVALFRCHNGRTKVPVAMAFLLRKLCPTREKAICGYGKIGGSKPVFTVLLAGTESANNFVFPGLVELQKEKLHLYKNK